VPTYTHTYENTHKRTSALLENHTIKGKESVPISKIIQGLDRTIPLLGLRSVHGQITLVSLRRNLRATDGKAYVYIVHYAQTNQFPKSITLSTCPRTLCTLRKVMIKMIRKSESRETSKVHERSTETGKIRTCTQDGFDAIITSLLPRGLIVG